MEKSNHFHSVIVPVTIVCFINDNCTTRNPGILLCVYVAGQIRSQVRSVPYFFTYKPIWAISQDPYIQSPSNRLMLPKKKKKSKTIDYKPRVKFLIVTGHLSERTSRKTQENGSRNTKPNELQ